MAKKNEVVKVDKSTAFKGIMQRQEMKQAIADRLPPHVKVEKFIRVVLTAVQDDPGLLEADQNSLLRAAMKCAADGLVPDGREAALVTFWSNKHQCYLVQYMPMVPGILKKVRNSGELKDLGANVVYENDTFEYWVNDDGEHFKHVPCFDGERGERRLAYAFARTKDGGFYFQPMSAPEIAQVAAVSRSKTKDGKPVGPWAEWIDEMWKKSAIRRLSKKLPMSSDLEGTITADDSFYDVKGDDSDVVEPDPINDSHSQQLRDIIEEQMPKTVDTEAEVVSEPEPEPAPTADEEDVF